MVSGINAAASGMMAQQLNIDVISNNLANVNTPGFKELIPVFKRVSDIALQEKSKEEGFNQDKNLGSLSTGSTLDSTIIDLKQGAMRKTDNKLDFAINGNGFFVVGTENGDNYTRNGSFTLNEEGTLVTKDGYPVLDESGSAIKIGQGNTNTGISFNKLNVAPDGKIFLDKQPVGKLKIVDFEKPTDLITAGNALFKTANSDIKPVEAKNGKVEQGFVEGSNSNVIETMINTISATRTYESLSKVVKTTEMTLGKAVNEVGRVIQ